MMAAPMAWAMSGLLMMAISSRPGVRSAAGIQGEQSTVRKLYSIGFEAPATVTT